MWGPPSRPTTGNLQSSVSHVLIFYYPILAKFLHMGFTSILTAHIFLLQLDLKTRKGVNYLVYFGLGGTSRIHDKLNMEACLTWDTQLI